MSAVTVHPRPCVNAPGAFSYELRCECGWVSFTHFSTPELAAGVATLLHDKCAAWPLSEPMIPATSN